MDLYKEIHILYHDVYSQSGITDPFMRLLKNAWLVRLLSQ